MMTCLARFQLVVIAFIRESVFVLAEALAKAQKALWGKAAKLAQEEAEI